MSEEYGLKFVVNGEDYDKIKKSLNEQIEDLQQKVKQLEKENEKLKYLVDDSHTMKAFIVEHNKVEQLENIRKEAIEYINHATIGADSSPIEDSWLYNLYETRHILSKGDNNGK